MRARAGGADMVGSVPPMSRPTRCRASCSVPTGSSALRATPDPSPRCVFRPAPAMSTSRRHQPMGRHKRGSILRTAWIRPWGMVSETVCRRPRRIRTPSGASTASKWNSLERRRHSPLTKLKRYAARNPPTATAVFGATMESTRRASAMARRKSVRPDRATEPTNRPVGTRAIVCSGIADSDTGDEPTALPAAASEIVEPPLDTSVGTRRWRSSSRTSSAVVSDRYARRPSEPPEPARRMRSSETPKSRASSGRTTSTAWMRVSGRRLESRRMRPVSMRRVSSSIFHRVTSQWTKPKKTESTVIAMGKYGGPCCVSCWTRLGRKDRTMMGTILPMRVSGESGCRRCQPPSRSRSCLTCRPPLPHRVRSADHAAERIRGNRGRECGHRWLPPPCGV